MEPQMGSLVRNRSLHALALLLATSHAAGCNGNLRDIVLGDWRAWFSGGTHADLVLAQRGGGANRRAWGEWPGLGAGDGRLRREPAGLGASFGHRRVNQQAWGGLRASAREPAFLFFQRCCGHMAARVRTTPRVAAALLGRGATTLSSSALKQSAHQPPPSTSGPDAEAPAGEGPNAQRRDAHRGSVPNVRRWELAARSSRKAGRPKTRHTRNTPSLRQVRRTPNLRQTRRLHKPAPPHSPRRSTTPPQTPHPPTSAPTPRVARTSA